MRNACITVLASLAASGSIAAVAPVTIYDSDGTPLSISVAGVDTPSLHAAAGTDETIDLWCCGEEPMDWSLNTEFYWATAFDTHDIAEPHQVTEILWLAAGGTDETYWIAPERDGLPDPAEATLLGSQSVPDSDFMWQSFDVGDAGPKLEPGRVYWLLRSAVGQDFDMTWRSTSNPDPPVPDPVALSLTFDGGWFKWTPGTDWHMEYEIRGVGPCAIALELSRTRLRPGEALDLTLGLQHNRLQTVTVPLVFSIVDSTGEVLLTRSTAPRTVHPGDHLGVDYRLTLPGHVVPGEYDLRVGVDEMQQGAAWATERFTVVGASPP